MTPVEAAAIAAIRAHAEKHRTSGRAVFSVAGIELLLRLFDEEQAQVFSALEAARSDIEEWIRCFPGDHYDSGYASDKVLVQIAVALERRGEAVFGQEGD